MTQRVPPEALALYTIYRNPSDYPGLFVLRRTLVSAAVVPDQEPMRICSTLSEVRAALPTGAYNLGREASDDPCIVETWI